MDWRVVLTERLERAFTPEHLEVLDDGARHAGHPGAAAGGHFRVVVVSRAFRGQDLLSRQRAVYAALGDALTTGVHALAVRTLTPEEWRRQPGPSRANAASVSPGPAPVAAMGHDVGLTHVALPVRHLDDSIRFYEKYARMTVVHRRRDNAGSGVAWVSDRTRPFVVVLLEVPAVEYPLRPSAHLGVGCASREEVDRLCALARSEGRLAKGPTDSGHPVGYWALISDPDGHTLEISHGQDVGLAVERATTVAGERR